MNFVSHLQMLYSTYGFRIVVAVILLIIGFFIVKLIRKITAVIIKNTHIEPTLGSFLNSLTGLIYYLLFFIIIFSVAGIPTSYFAGVIIGLVTAIGFSLKDEVKTISNGILILLTKPFKVGDIIKVGNFAGVVKNISLFQTKLTTFDNMEVIMTNAQMFSTGLVRLNANKTRRQDIIIGVSYDDDIKSVKTVLENIIKENKFILKEPASKIVINEFADSSVNFLIRFWVNGADFLNAKFTVNERIKIIFDEQNISIPFPQQDIHMIKNE
ncbi:MAG TPA: mechanosensitive ion channel [Victivallales bacterium]|nr:mechanosensitive ion channel [Victivallales bacterium]